MLCHKQRANENRKYNSIYVFLIVLGGGGYAVCVLTRLHAPMSIAKLDDIYFPVRYLQHIAGAIVCMAYVGGCGKVN